MPHRRGHKPGHPITDFPPYRTLIDELLDESKGWTESSVFDPLVERKAKGVADFFMPKTRGDVVVEAVLGGYPLAKAVGWGAKKIAPYASAGWDWLRPLVTSRPFDRGRREALEEISGKSTVDQVRKRGAMYGPLHSLDRGKIGDIEKGWRDFTKGDLNNPAKSAAIDDLLEKLDAADRVGRRTAQDVKIKPFEWDDLDVLDTGATPGTISKGGYVADDFSDVPSDVADLRYLGEDKALRKVYDPSVLDMTQEYGNRLGRLVREGVAKETGKAVREEAPEEASQWLDDLLRRVGVDVSRRKPK
jgi:hypothetical protein